MTLYWASLATMEARSTAPVNSAIDLGNTFEIRRDDAAVIREVAFDKARTDIDVAELDSQVVADSRDFHGFRNIGRQLAGNFRQETTGDNGLQRIIHRLIEGCLFQGQAMRIGSTMVIWSPWTSRKVPMKIGRATSVAQAYDVLSIKSFKTTLVVLKLA